jgi:[ribosomal protein S18]-alanine N-acetyltransferase
VTPAEMAALHWLCFTTPRPWSALEFTAMLDSDHTFVLTAPHAFLIGRAVAGEAELLTLAVSPDARRQGTARHLVTQFLTRSRIQNATDAFLEVAADNAPAIALYGATGFVQTGKRRAYYANAVDALIMTQRLTPRPAPDF